MGQPLQRVARRRVKVFVGLKKKPIIFLIFFLFSNAIVLYYYTIYDFHQQQLNIGEK